jgi:hypothetical protein
MSSISWAGAVSGDWATGANWSGGVVPGANDDVTIALNGAFTVDITTPVSAKTLTLNNPGATVLDTGSLTLTGALTLTAGTFNLGTGGAIVGGTIVGNGTITAAIANNGSIEAKSGTLTIAGAVSGSGGLQIDANATLELGSTSADPQGVSFAGANGTLLIDTPSAYSGVITGFGANETIDLKNTVATGATLTGTTITVMLSGGGTQNYTLAAPLPGSELGVASDGNGGTLITEHVLNAAQATVNTTVPIDFGNHHVGDLVTQAISITNSASTITPSAALDASFASAPSGFTASGSVSMLAAGATDASLLKLGLSTAVTGGVNGIATLKLSSDDGTTQTALTPQTIHVSGAVYAYAAPILANQIINLGATRVGAALNGSVTLSDGKAVNSFQERLVYTDGAAPLGYSVTGATSGTIASGKSTSIGLSLTAATAGNFSGRTLSLRLTSTGAGTSGLADTALASQTLILEGKVYATAVAHLSATIINFGTVHVGDVVAVKKLGVSNTATGILTDVLVGGFGTVTGPFTASGNLGAGVAAGSSGTLTVGFNAANSGAFTGTANLALSSHDSDLANIGVTTGAVTLKAIVDKYAVAGFKKTAGSGSLVKQGNIYRLNLGSIAKGGKALSTTISAFNAVVGVADKLAGTFTSKASTGLVFSLSGFVSFSGLGAGQSTAGMKITLSTAKTGTFTETITLASKGSNTSGYNGAVAPITLVVTGTVVAPAHSSKLEASRNSAAEGNALSATPSLFSPSSVMEQVANANQPGGAPSLGDASHAAAVGLFGQFIAANFHTVSDGGAGTTFAHVPTEAMSAALALHH